MALAERSRITIAIAAMGGQGGGVLADWILTMGEHAGYFAQTTSVPGVAQRTGATIYYLELFPGNEQNRTPVLALMPIPGDVDIVVAAELAEAGRAVQRGIVTPDRTTLIASDHRSYAYAEKSAMGDGRTSSNSIREAIGKAAKRVVCFDMQTLAETHGTVISATLFGALAGVSLLPFSREQFEAAITATGKSTSKNLAAFSAAFDIASGHIEKDTERPQVPTSDAATPTAEFSTNALLERVAAEIESGARDTACHGVKRLVDYQDPAYAALYLDRLRAVQTIDVESDAQARLTDHVARQLALWMSYEDTIRVADLKIRRDRFERCRQEIQAADNEIVYLTEFMHPRVEEVVDTLPYRAGRWLRSTSWAQGLLRNYILRERKIYTSKIGGFLLLYFVSSLRRRRRGTYRYTIEQERIEDWLQKIQSYAANNYELAIELAHCQNLIKGYGDTHARGLKNFDSIMRTLDGYQEKPRDASLIRELRLAALADENGEQLAARLRQVA